MTGAFFPAYFFIAANVFAVVMWAKFLYRVVAAPESFRFPNNFLLALL